MIDKDGGAKRILGCGQAVSYLGFQTILAWDLDRDISDIGWQPERSLRQAKPIVLFEPYGAGWKVRPIHTNRASCKGLSTTTAFG